MLGALAAWVLDRPGAMLGGDDPAASQRVASELRSGLDPGTLEALVGGEAAVLSEAKSRTWGALGPLELLAAPLAVLALELAFAPRLVAAPLLAAATGLLGAVAVIGVVNELTTISVLGAAPAGVVAVALAIESSWTLAARYRDEAATLGPRGDALRRTLDGAGRAVVAIALAAAAVAGALAVAPVLDARSVALGAVVAALLTGAVALIATPSLLVLASRRTRSGSSPDAGGDRWLRVASIPSRRPALAAGLAIVGVAALIALAAPLLRLDTVPVAAASLPAESDARRADALAAAALGSASVAPVLAATESVDRDALSAYRRELAGLEGVAEIGPPQTPGSEVGLMRAGTEARPGSLGARDAVESIRSIGAPGASVGGNDAAALDADRALRDWLGPTAGVAVVVLTVLLAVVLRPGSRSRGRRWLCAAGLSALSLLPAAAAAGLLVLVFQDGRLTSLLSYDPQGGIVIGAALATLAAVAGVSALTSVGFASTVAEERDVGLGGRAAVERASALTLPAAGAAIGIAGAATLVLLGVDVAPAKQFGLGVAAGLVVDLLLVRSLAAPLLARLAQ